ncbi:unnamed protein product, partial [Amoebophrya sp. A25]
HFLRWLHLDLILAQILDLSQGESLLTRSDASCSWLSCCSPRIVGNSDQGDRAQAQ